MTDFTYVIPLRNAPVFERKIAKLAKQAAKCATALEWHNKGTTSVRHPNAAHAAAGERIAVNTYTVTADTPRIEGFTLVGTLDHMALPNGGVLVSSVPGESVPTEYQGTCGKTCDHCNKTRTRRMTIVLRNDDDNSHIVVGRSCVRDFIGYSINSTLAYLEGLHALQNASFDEDDWGMGGGYACGQAYSVVAALSRAAAIIRREGYHGANHEGERTSDKMHSCFETPTFHGRNAEQQYKNFMAWKTSVEPTEADDTLVIDAMRWIANVDATGNNYLYNLQQIVSGGYCTLKLAGYLVSLVTAYQREMGQLELRATREAEKAEAADCPSGRMVITGTIISIKLKEGYYSDVLKMTVKTDEGYCVWGSVPNGLESDNLKGSTIQFTATVEQSDSDSKFGFFKRPTKAELV